MGNSSTTPAPKMYADQVVVQPSAKHTATVIFLHGLADSGNGWSQTFERIRLPHVKYICPTANSIPVTINSGMKMPSWFDIYGLDPLSKQDESGVRSSAAMLQQLIKQEEKLGIPRSRIIIGGFSQGGAVALYSAFALSEGPVGGIIGLSTWLPVHYKFPDAVKSNRSTPVLQCHGQNDQLVICTFGTMTGQLIKSFNSAHELKLYQNMGHNSCEEEMQDVAAFIEKILNEPAE